MSWFIVSHNRQPEPRLADIDHLMLPGVYSALGWKTVVLGKAAMPGKSCSNEAN
jgi:hypothetical protein